MDGRSGADRSGAGRSGAGGSGVGVLSGAAFVLAKLAKFILTSSTDVPFAMGDSVPLLISLSLMHVKPCSMLEHLLNLNPRTHKG